MKELSKFISISDSKMDQPDLKLVMVDCLHIPCVAGLLNSIPNFFWLQILAAASFFLTLCNYKYKAFVVQLRLL